MPSADTPDHAERFTRLWTTAQPAVAGYLAALVSDFRDSQDLLQTVAVVALKKFGEFDPSRSFVGWTLGIARWEVLHYRRGRARSRLELDESMVESMTSVCEELSEEFERRARALHDCLRGLDGRSSEMLRLRYDEALTPAAMASRLGLSAVAVRVALSRIRSSLRKCIEGKLQAITR